MEFQEALMRLEIRKLTKKGFFEKDTETGKQKWKISFRRSPSKPQPKRETPKEFLCPISGFLMSDPVIVSSGHTFERASIQACKALGFTPIVMDGTLPDFSSVIPNLALKSAILNWCKKNYADPPKPLDFFSAETLVRSKMKVQQQKSKSHEKNDDQEAVISERDLIQRVEEKPSLKFNYAETELDRCPIHSYSSSDESVGNGESTLPLQLKTRPSCYSSASSASEIEILHPNDQKPEEEEELITKLYSPQVFEVEEALISLRKITRAMEDSRVQYCTSRLLSALRSLIISRYTNIQVNSVASLVNFSLEKINKVKIVRSGIVPLLIDVLKSGFPEAQEHACGAIFSLALDDHNKAAIGVLGALPPLLHLLRSNNERTRHDSALALYHLSLVQSNRTKLVKLGSVPLFLGMVKSGHMKSRILLILGNLASCVDGRAAILDSGGVECLVGVLGAGELVPESTRESCVSVLYRLSHGGLRFKGLAKAAGATEVLSQVVDKSGSERAREKARRILELMRRRAEEEEEEGMDWEELLELRSTSRTLRRVGGGKE